MINRDIVYEAIDSEREYQDKRWPLPAHRHNNTEFLVYIDHYVKEAFKELSTSDGDHVAPHLRKIAALAVAAMEQNGVIFR